MKVRGVTAERCVCDNGYYVDRYISPEKKGCPACDPELGNTAKARIAAYKNLISKPVPKRILDILY